MTIVSAHFEYDNDDVSDFIMGGGLGYDYDPVHCVVLSHDDLTELADDLRTAMPDTVLHAPTGGKEQIT